MVTWASWYNVSVFNWITQSDHLGVRRCLYFPNLLCGSRVCHAAAPPGMRAVVLLVWGAAGITLRLNSYGNPVPACRRVSLALVTFPIYYLYGKKIQGKEFDSIYSSDISYCLIVWYRKGYSKLQSVLSHIVRLCLMICFIYWYTPYKCNKETQQRVKPCGKGLTYFHPK